LGGGGEGDSGKGGEVGGAGMSSETLRELLKPPFVYGGEYKWDWETYHIRVGMDDGETSILKVMPIADIGYYVKKFGSEEKYWSFLKDLAEFTVTALEEKWERDFGVRKWWILTIETIACKPVFKCPECEDIVTGICTDYCPHCGVKLDPPEIK
jgi:hypothetical protein